MFQGIIDEMFDQQILKTSPHPTSDLGSRRCGFKPLVRFMACDSESMESFNILRQQTINGDISQLILLWKDGDGLLHSC